MASNDQPIEYRSKAGVAYGELRNRILSGALRPGAPLNQEQLAAELGLSTTPLREAIRRLESEGLVRTRAHRDATVAPLDPEEVDLLFEVRRTLDGLSARLAARNLDEEGRERIEAAVSELATPHDDPVAANRRFHRSIYLAANNRILIEHLESLWDFSDRYRRFTRDIAQREDVATEHQALAEAVLAGDAERAEQLMLAHIQIAHDTIREAVLAAVDRNGSEPVAVPARSG